MRHIFALLALMSCRALAAVNALPSEVVNTHPAGDAPLAATQALARMKLPEGFRATLFAAEPNVMHPIAFDFDDRGRLWVVECFSYPEFKVQDRDRVLIFTDRDGDGRFDERKVFLERGHRLSGITLGFGGVWLTSAPNLLFVPDENGDDIPDGDPQVLLDGWTLKAGHNMVNGLIWGPDGWLYGRHGITAPSLVGKPGTPEKERTFVSCSIWRYHPVKKIFEVVANGTTNPWGLDWDDFGQPFFSNNVIGHLWHLVPGAHYKRMFGEDPNPRTYQLLDQTADHLHWAGSDWTKSRGGVGEHDTLGGGHSHAGAMIYLGDNWPAAFRNRLMMANIHGNRLLYDELIRKGSGYVAGHGSAFLMANDPWFRAVQISYGPDGGVFVTDWNDLGECHDYDGSFRTSGRIYKVTYGAPAKLDPALDLAKLPDAELVKLQLHASDWYVRHARRLIQERAAKGKLAADTATALTKLLREHTDVTRQLRALWALHAIGALRPTMQVSGDPRFQKQPQDLRARAGVPSPSPLLLELLDHKDENLRWWAIQLLVEDKFALPMLLQRFAMMARNEKSPFVRLSLASALQRLPLTARLPIAEGLASHVEDTADAWLPLMIWYGIEPAVPEQRAQALRLAANSKIPLVREFIARRLSE
jgi:putative membrane-bound dehydrogenase-like protein